MTSKYISYHAFNWWFQRNKFCKSITKSGGAVLEKKKVNGIHIIQISNPSNDMKKHPDWYKSNVYFWMQPSNISNFKTNNL